MPPTPPGSPLMLRACIDLVILIIEGKTLHQCEVCKEVLIRRQDLVEHMVKHTNKLPFVSTP